MEHSVLAHIRQWMEHGGLDNTPVAVAVSGGIDSMVLWHALETLGVSVAVVLHVNFHLREDSHIQEALIVKEGKRYGREVLVHHCTPPETGNREAWARRERYAWFAEESVARGGLPVLLAHHGDDQLETVLLHISRGTGLEGLRPMAEQRGCCYRPLLGVNKASLVEYGEEHRVPYYEDYTNRDHSLLRNGLRHAVLSPWKELVPTLDKQWRGVMEEAAEVVQYVEEQVYNTTAWKEWEKHGVWEVAAVEAMPEVLQRVLFRKCYGAVVGHTMGVERVMVETWRHWILKGQSGTVCVLGAMGTWRKEHGKGVPVTEEATLPSQQLNIGGTVQWGGWTITCEERKRREEGEEHVLWLEVQEGTELHVRPWRHGDRFHPLGAPGSKKLSDYCSNKKIPLSKRSQMPVVVDEDDRVLGVYTCPDEGCRVSAVPKGVCYRIQFV